MILYNLGNLILNLLIAIFGELGIPSFPADVMDILEFSVSIFQTGFGILGNFLDFPYLGILLELVICIDITFFAYHSCMFILKKIPFLGIK